MIVYQASNLDKVVEQVETWGQKSEPAKIVSCQKREGYLLYEILNENAFAFVARLRWKPEVCFDHFIDLTAVDYSEYPQNLPGRFGVVLTLQSARLGVRVQVKIFVEAEKPQLPTFSTLFDGALWCEREVYDLFGIVFTDHPDLKRILLPEEYEGHPLRKDYPLMGKGERANFPVYTGQR